jgi:RimJ/RimL family protein N-acetyltransferase
VLRGEQVVLAPLRKADVETLFGWINDRHDVVSAAGYKPVHEEPHRLWAESVVERADTVIFGIRTVEDDRLVGYVQLAGIDPRARSAELRIRVGDADARGHGVGYEASGLALRHGFDDLNLRRIWAHCFATNEPVLRGADTLGFRREGLLRQNAYVAGEYVDVVVIGILRDEFQPPPSIMDGRKPG